MAAAPVVGRYAPSPTGPLHLGNLRTALVCWLQVRLAGGRMLLRLDDLDQPRNRPGSADQIRRDLEWLGLHWDDDVIVQTRRAHDYQSAFSQLLKAGALFPCRCSRRDIATAAAGPDPSAMEPRYPGTCRPENHPAPMKPGEPVAWRFRVNDAPLDWQDEILGEHCANLADRPGDFVVRRKDGIFAYQLASVVDDALTGVTDILRGADLVDSTARQIALFRALGYPVPRFWHVPLMTDGGGEKLSKRDGAESLEALRSRGMEAADIIGRLGSSLGLCAEGAALSAEDLAVELGRRERGLAEMLRGSDVR